MRLMTGMITQLSGEYLPVCIQWSLRAAVAVTHTQGYLCP